MTILNEKSRTVIIPATSLRVFTIDIEYEFANTINIYIKEDVKKDKVYTLLKDTRDYSIVTKSLDDSIIRISEITLTKPITSAGAILISRVLPITQTWDADYVVSEHSKVREGLFDESRMIEQQLKAAIDVLDEKYEYIKIHMPAYQLLDPIGKVYGKVIITDGHDSFKYYDFKLVQPNASTPDNSILTLDKNTKEIKYVAYTGVNNAPTPAPSTLLKHLISENGTYRLSATYDHLFPTDTNVVYVYNGSSFVKKSAGTLDNPIIPIPTSPDKVLEYNSSSQIVWAKKTEELPPAVSPRDNGKVLKVGTNSKPIWEKETEQLPKAVVPIDFDKVLKVDVNGNPVWEKETEQLPPIDITTDVGKTLQVNATGDYELGVKIKAPTVTTVIKNAVFKDGVLQSSKGGFAAFYGFKVDNNNHLILSTGKGDFVVKDYKDWTIAPDGIVFTINYEGHLIATI